MMLLKGWTQYVSKFGNLSSNQKTGTIQFSFQYQRRAMSSNVQTTMQLCSFHILSRQCSKSLKVGFSSTWNKNFQMYKLGLEKAEEPEIKWPTYIESWRKQGSFRKKSTSALLTTWKPFTVWITTNCAKFLESREYQTTLPVSWKTFKQVKKQQLEPYMEQLTSSKLGKEYDKAVYCHSVYLTYMQITVLGAAVDGVTKSQNILCKMLGWMNHKL